MTMPLARFESWWIVTVAVALGSWGTAHAKDLVRVAIPSEDFHDPLYVDADSIQWQGDVVQFKYILDVPLLGVAGAEVRFRSNEIEAIVDCAAQTISTGDAIVYSGRAATGDMIFGQTATAAEKRPIKIDHRRYSTNGYLFRHLCERARRGATRLK